LRARFFRLYAGFGATVAALRKQARKRGEQIAQSAFFLGIVWLAVPSPGVDFAMVSQRSFGEGRNAGLTTGCRPTVSAQKRRSARRS